MECKYKAKGGLCELLTTACDPRGFYIPNSFCSKSCKPNDIAVQFSVLKRLGFDLPMPPKDKDLLGWARECIANGTAKLTPQAEAIQKKKAEQAKVIAKLPTWFQQAKNLHEHAGQIAAHFVRTGHITVTPEQKADRLAACDYCEKLWVNPKTGNRRCSACGCHVDALVGDNYGKADFEALTCKNWPDIALGG